MLDNIFEAVQKTAMWVSSRPNRLRLRGARIEVVALILTRAPKPAILLGKSPYHKMWMPPQEGVRISETFEQALDRCLREECGINLRHNSTDRLYVRSIRFVDMLDLPKERFGERLVADDAVDTPFEHIRLRRKAYWQATILVGDAGQLFFKPDGQELIELKWFELEEARQVILETNHPEKSFLIIRCLEACERDLHGATSSPTVERND